MLELDFVLNCHDLYSTIQFDLSFTLFLWKLQRLNKLGWPLEIKLRVNNNNNYDNLYGAVTRPYRYKGASQATKQARLDSTVLWVCSSSSLQRVALCENENDLLTTGARM